MSEEASEEASENHSVVSEVDNPRSKAVLGVDNLWGKVVLGVDNSRSKVVEVGGTHRSDHHLPGIRRRYTHT